MATPPSRVSPEWLRESERTNEEEERIREALLDYCKMDTLATVKFHEDLIDQVVR